MCLLALNFRFFGMQLLFFLLCPSSFGQVKLVDLCHTESFSNRTVARTEGEVGSQENQIYICINIIYIYIIFINLMHFWQQIS